MENHNNKGFLSPPNISLLSYELRTFGKVCVNFEY